MEIAFVLFEGMTSLDLIGVYDPLTRLKSMGFLPEMDWDFCALDQEVRDDRGLLYTPDRVEEELEGYDLLIVPGGHSTRHLRYDDEFIEWLKTGEQIPIKCSVCTGSLLLAAAGMLDGYRATCHPTELETLAEYGIATSPKRVVDEGAIITARGVSSSLDLGLHLVERIAGFEVRAKIAKQMDYVLQ